MGFVYVFNATTQVIRLDLSTGLTSLIQPTSKSSSAPYTPTSMQVQRGSPPFNGTAFVDGEANSVTVETRGLSAEPASVPVPAAGEGTDDLWLYTFFDLLLLIQTDGTVSAQVPVQWSSASSRQTRRVVSPWPPTAASTSSTSTPTPRA